MDGGRHLPTDELIDRILSEFHEGEYARLLGISALVDAETGPGASVLSERWHAFVHQAVAHFRREEELLFPLMRLIAAEGADVSLAKGPLPLLMVEHNDAIGDIAVLLELAESASPQIRAAIGAVEERLRRHLQYENEVLFPRFLTRSSPAEGIEPPAPRG